MNATKILQHRCSPPRAIVTANARLQACLLSLAGVLIGAGAIAAPPELYRDAAHESPVRADPDDLLLLAGYGFAADDTVVYRALADTTQALTAPGELPAESGAYFGVAPVVSSADVPYALTIRLPLSMRTDQSYALWVHTARGEWSKGVKINDARPLWVSPAYVYASGMPGFLPREIKIVGRNLRPMPGRSTQVRLVGPERLTGLFAASAGSSEALADYVARIPLPGHLTPGGYRVQVSRDGASWIEVPDQALEVLADPRPAGQFSVGDAKFGGCRPDDGADDTPCILRALAAAASAGGGSVYFGPGSWDLIDGSQAGVVAGEGLVVPAGVDVRGAGSAVTQLLRHARWTQGAATAAFTLTAHTLITGFTFRDLEVYEPSDPAVPYLELGEDWRRAAAPGASEGSAPVSDLIITRNVFDKPLVAISSGGLPIQRLFVTYNTFGAYRSALELSGDQYNMIHRYRLDDSVIDHNTFKPGSELDAIRNTGTIASELGAGHRVDFSGNTADGASTDYLYAPGDARGWRAAFFWNLNANVEETLVSQNTATCTGDKIGDGEAMAFDDNTNTFAFAGAAAVVRSTASGVSVSAPLAARQHDRDVPVASYYIDHWVQVVSGVGLGQVRKIVGYSTDAAGHLTTLRVAPAWDVVPAAGDTRIAIGREYWQLYVVDNRVDNRLPLCQKSNRSRRAGGAVALWAASADSVFAGNQQHDSDGIFVQQVYAAAEHACADCSMLGSFNYFLELRDNVIDGEYDWTNDCSRSGIGLGVGAATSGDVPPPTVSFGVSLSHNVIRHADEQYGGAIAQVNTSAAGPEPHRWPLSDNVLIFHNSIADIDGARAVALCGASRPRIGIAFPDPAIAWRTVLYANSCKHVSMPIGDGGVGLVKVCPSSAPDSCECPPRQ